MRPTRSRLPIIALGLAVSILRTSGVHASLLGVDEDTGNLYQISTADASLTLLGNLGVSLGSLEWSPDGQLYGMSTGALPQLYRINPAIPSATAVGPLGNPIFTYEGGLCFAPDGTAYAVNLGQANADTLFHVNLLTGLATSIAVLTGEHDINGLAYRSDGMLVGIDSAMNALISINPSNGAISLIRDLSALNRNGEPIVGSNGGMTLVGDTGYFATANLGATIPGSNELYAFDPFTGATTLIGSFSAGLSDRGISGLAAPEPASLLLLLVSGAFALRRHRRN